MENPALTYDDIMLVPNYNNYVSRRHVDISVEDKRKKLKLGIPIMSSNMDAITGSEMANFLATKGGIGVLHRFMDIEKNIAEFHACKTKVFVSLGCSDKEMERAEALRDAGAEYFCVDVAHAHARYVGQALRKLKEILSENACIMVGNVATYAGADYLSAMGADLIKVGIGGGSVCTTRIKTGFGVPSLSSIKECSKLDRSVVADGGIRFPGDIVKALSFGADFVMIGGILAGTRPTPGKVITRKDGKKIKKFRGMASSEAQIDFMGILPDWKTAEGVSVEVPYRENEEEILADIIGGLRSGLTYAGAENIPELQRKVNYTKVTNAGLQESFAHKKKS